MDKCFQDFERGACAGDQRCKDEVSKLVEPQQYSLLDWSKSGDLIAVVAFGQASTCDDKPISPRLANDAAIFRISSTASRLHRRLLPMKRQMIAPFAPASWRRCSSGDLSSVNVWEAGSVSMPCGMTRVGIPLPRIVPDRAETLKTAAASRLADRSQARTRCLNHQLLVPIGKHIFKCQQVVFLRFPARPSDSTSPKRTLQKGNG